jgi:DNA polymerase-3 subunit beta
MQLTKHCLPWARMTCAPAMTGVNFELTPEGITFVATDAHRLVRYKRLDAKATKATSFIVPKKALQLLGNAIPAEETQVKNILQQLQCFFQFRTCKAYLPVN